jgi:Cof subfamily protein (haloacid dehalogenase superfamily)
MYKALITDLDGTAVAISSTGDDVDAATQRAVQRAIQTGKKLACASGRNWKTVQPVVQKLGFVSPCIIEGGTRVIDPLTEKTLWEKPLARDASTKILHVFKAESKIGVVMTSANVAGAPLDATWSVPKDLRFIYLLAVPEPTAIKISNRINADAYAVAHLTPSWAGGDLIDIHVTHPEATKEHAIEIWQKREGISKAETIGLGDSGNDIPIFQSAGLKIAVANATASLMQLADYIAPSVGDNALEHVINKFLL